MLRFLKYLSYVCVFMLRCTNSLVIQDLGGAWNVKDTGNEYDLPATVPGGIYSDLMNNDVIGDVFWSFNDRDLRWVALKNWTYSRKFTVSQEFLDHDNINIVFNGIDTFATVFINDVEVGTTDNMFVRYEFTVKDQLQHGENAIEINFLSPVLIAEDLYDEQAESYLVPPACLPDEYQGVCHANHVRKMQASFAWDWGPAFPSVGIWKPLYLEAYDSAVIRDVIVSTQLNNESDVWDIEVHTYFADTLSSVINGTLTIVLGVNTRYTVVNSIVLHQDESGEFVDKRQFSVPADQVNLWWPNGYGNAQLYEMTVTFTNPDESEQSIKAFKVGFRTIELVQNEVADGAGTSFYFVVNNIPIFAKGVNTIPINVLPEKGQDPARIRFLLQSAKDVHMNMLRVWGGGVYESDEFYEITDEMGILVWQDFMFACSMYPTNENFLSTVRQEVKHQVRRLQYHASVALWAANNENEAALRQNWYGTGENFDLYKEDFVKLYVDTVRVEVFESDTSRQFLTSSPTNGIKSEEEGYVAENPASTMYGDVHYYNYIGDSWDQNIFPVTRFASEYGYQSLPSWSTLLTATNNSADLHYNSEFLLHRQHHLNGYDEIRSLINLRLTLPDADNNNYFKAFVFYSQIIQAMGVKQQTEHYRMWRSEVNSVGEGLTMGALYWQLNDVWVAPTWAGIDFKLNWKMLHYYAQDFFAPVIISSQLQSDRNVKLFAVSDLLTNTYNVTARVTVYKWDSFDPIHEEVFNVDMFSGFSNEITTFWLDDYLQVAGCGALDKARNRCFIYLTLEDANSNVIAPENYIFPGPLHSAEIVTGVVTVSSQESNSNGLEFELNVTTNAISLFVWLESGNVRGRFSDNGFHLIADTKTVFFYSEEATSLDIINENIRVTHLLDAQYL